MVFEVGPVTRHSADLFAVKLLSYLIVVMEEEVGKTDRLSEISILTGGYETATAIERRDEKVSKRHLYIVTRNERDAETIESAILMYASDTLLLQDTLKKLDPDFKSLCWLGEAFDFYAQDVIDMLAATALISPRKQSPKCFRGIMSWIES